MAVSGNLRQDLHGRGQRLTPQRQRVLDLFERTGAGHHLSAEDVHQQLLRGDSRVSLATVYRTLRLLTTMDLLRQLELPEGGKRFELATDDDHDHHHLICVACGRTEEFESEEVLAAGADAADRFGFKLLSPRLTVRGLCPSCVATQEGQSPLTVSLGLSNLNPKRSAASAPAARTSSLSNSSVRPQATQMRW